MSMTPCRGCDKRRVNCHAECKDYLAWRKKADELREQKHKANNLEADFIRTRIKQSRKSHKK